MATNSEDSFTFNLGNTNTKIHKVTVKPPAFSRNKPKLLFLQLEAQFSNSSILNDTTKYNIIVAALDENVLDFVVDILSNPPHDDKYETLNALLNRLTDTGESRLKKLLTDMELGDRRPPNLLRQMKSLAGSSISDELINSLWLPRHPQQTQVILSISKDSINNVAEMADKIIVVYSSSEELDLLDSNTFRDFTKPMGAQTPERLNQFQKRFKEWDDPHGETPPYHYGTFYSSAMIVASYLVRMEPFTQHFLHLQVPEIGINL
ncbi:WD repeat and FYVE domain-containing protein 3 [Trichonephila clavipes]|uniref:WD repeat and FYVE domain-containing protein 3 n=1 Tax=Trichonephila clavipes TaxID=2585209 RepID=A0A8X6SCW9_TRICX|nr:WD repeat and FYVE domain-containing protein 3 [Trichonephila clavipes]